MSTYTVRQATVRTATMSSWPRAIIFFLFIRKNIPSGSADNFLLTGFGTSGTFAAVQSFLAHKILAKCRKQSQQLSSCYCFTEGLFSSQFISILVQHEVQGAFTASALLILAHSIFKILGSNTDVRKGPWPHAQYVADMNEIIAHIDVCPPWPHGN